MIDWQVIVNGEFPAGWDPRVDGCGFPDFAMQYYLLPFFDVGEQPIDEYGGTVFEAGDLRRLHAHLTWRRDYLEAKQEPWILTETCGARSQSYELRREAALEVVANTANRRPAERVP
jgi:hypothetical protein